ncbi:unnamed protein product, partial [Arctogadus glacialis]
MTGFNVIELSDSLCSLIGRRNFDGGNPLSRHIWVYLKAFDGLRKSFKMSERPARIRHRMTELRDRLNAQINQILTEVQAEGSSVMDRLQVFRQEPGARSVPRRRRGTRTGRPRQITLKVSVLRSDINSV